MFKTRLANDIDIILWEKWDPIGVNEFDDDARDEYWSYIADIERLVESRSSVDKIAEYLHTVETSNMGLGGDKERCRRVAVELAHLAVKTGSA